MNLETVRATHTQITHNPPLMGIRITEHTHTHTLITHICVQ